MEIKHVEGIDKGKMILYALSTCGWCKKIKRFLNSSGIAYFYVDVDLLDGEEKDAAKKTIMRWNPKCSYPTLVLNEKECIVGYDEDELRKAIGI